MLLLLLRRRRIPSKWIRHGRSGIRRCVVRIIGRLCWQGKRRRRRYPRVIGILGRRRLVAASGRCRCTIGMGSLTRWNNLGWHWTIVFKSSSSCRKRSVTVVRADGSIRVVQRHSSCLFGQPCQLVKILWIVFGKGRCARSRRRIVVDLFAKKFLLPHTLATFQFFRKSLSFLAALMSELLNVSK